MTTELVIPLIQTVSRVVVGLVFGISFSAKAVDPIGFERAVREFEIIPEEAIRVASLLVIAAEVGVVFLLAGGSRAPILAGFLLAIFLLMSFSGALLSVLRRNIHTSCRCFGPSVKPVTYRNVLRNLILVSVATTGLLVSLRV